MTYRKGDRVRYVMGQRVYHVMAVDQERRICCIAQHVGITQPYTVTFDEIEKVHNDENVAP